MKIERKTEQKGQEKKHWKFDLAPRETIAIITTIVGPIVSVITAHIYHFM